MGYRVVILMDTPVGLHAEDASDKIHNTREAARQEIVDLLMDPLNAGEVFDIEETFS